MTLSGVIPPVITPLTDDGSLDLPALERLLERLIAAGVGGLFMLGTSGEGPWLKREQQIKVLEVAVRVAAGQVPVIAGVLEPSTGRVVEALSAFENVGVDALALTTPYYFGVSDTAQLHHFERVLEATNLPVVLYNIPSATHNSLSVETVRQLARHPHVLGIKDSTGDREHFRRLLELKTAHDGFSVLQGAEVAAGEALLAGADGVVAGLANLEPEPFVQMLEAARRGDEARVRVLQARVAALWELHTHGHWLSCLKYAAHLRGCGCGKTLGLEELAPDAQAQIADVLSLYQQGGTP